jgi:hypothetical protein
MSYSAYGTSRAHVLRLGMASRWKQERGRRMAGERKWCDHRQAVRADAESSWQCRRDSNEPVISSAWTRDPGYIRKLKLLKCQSYLVQWYVATHPDNFETTFDPKA